MDRWINETDRWINGQMDYQWKMDKWIVNEWKQIICILWIEWCVVLFVIFYETLFVVD